MQRDIIYTLDQDGYLRHVNERWIETLGHRKAMGSSFASLVNIENLSTIGSAFSEFAHNKVNSRNIRYKIRNSKGQFVNFDSKWSVLYDSHGDFSGILGHALELPGKIELSEDYLRAHVGKADPSCDIMYAFDKSGRYLYVNDVWAKQLGHDPLKVVGTPMASMIHVQDHSECGNSFKKVVGDGKKRKLRYRIKGKDGKHMHYSSTWHPLKDSDGKNIGVVGLAKHIAEEKRGDIGIGTLIIFISMILVASIAGGVLVRSSVSLQTKALIAGEKASTHAATSIRTVSLTATNGSDHFIDHFEHKIMLGASEPVNLMQAIITIDTFDTSIDLVYGTGNCTYDSTMGANGSLGFYSNMTQGIGFFTVETIVSGVKTDNGYLLEGNLVRLCYAAPRPIEQGERIRLKILPKVGNAEVIDTIVPDIITTEKVNIY